MVKNGLNNPVIHINICEVLHMRASTHTRTAVDTGEESDKTIINEAV